MTTQTKAVSQANALVAMMQTLQTFRSQAAEFVREYTSENYAALWSALPTAAINADGSLGSADAAPNPAHPITTGGINRPANALVAGVGLLQDFAAFVNNGAVPTALRSQTIDDLVG